MAAFLLAYHKHRGVEAKLTPAETKQLKGVAQAMGVEAFRAALEQFFGLDDRWVKQQGYSVAAFLSRRQRCHELAQNRAAYEARERERQRLEGEESELTPEDIALFEAAEGKRPPVRATGGTAR